MSKTIKVGFVQTLPVFGDIAANLKRVEELLTGKEADLIVLPELFSTGYQFKDASEAKNLAEPIPDGPTTKFLSQLAGNTNAVIVAGIAEKYEKEIFNSAIVAGPGGLIGHYQKAHAFDSEVDIFQPGATPFQVFETDKFRVGVMICFDWRFPEAARSLALNGADIIAHPANLVLPHCPQAMITRCLENRVYAVTADRVGVEDRVPGQPPLKFIGQSQVVDPDGNILYRASEDHEELKIVEIDIQKARNKKINERNDLFVDRREDLYRLK